jgi:citrate synthase
VRRARGFSVLKEKMEVAIAARQQEVREFNKEHGKTPIGEITVGQVIGGMRGMPGMLYETSKLHPTEGIEYRGMDLFKIREKAPKTIPGGQPIPEGVLWLLLTGELPTEKETESFKEDMFKRGQLTADEEKLIKGLPKDMHPMTQLSAGTLICQPRSKFAEAY